jgi:hypothetical protein
MGELRTLKIVPCLVLRDVPTFSDAEIADMLHAAKALGFDLRPGSPFEDVTLGELELLVRDAGLPS